MIGALSWKWWATIVALMFVTILAQEVRISRADASLAQLQAEHAKTLQDHAEALQRAEAQARATESGLRADMDRIQAHAAKEKADAKAREDALVDRVRTGERRLWLAASRCVPAGQAGGGATPAGSSGPGEARAELDRETGLALFGIARDGDQAIRERNACVAAYEALRQRLNDAPSSD